MTNILCLKDVSVFNKRGPRLKDISLTIKQGERIALIGPSGAGKSTLLSIANGSLKADKGDVTWFDVPVRKLTQRQRTGIGTLWQDLRLVEELTVGQNVNAGALGRHNLIWSLLNLVGQVETDKCMACIKAAGLEEHLINISVKNLSGGQRQRVALARLLRQNAELLLADEPLSSLDPALSKEILLLLLSKTIKNESIIVPKTIVMTLHTPELLIYFDRFIGLKNGILVLDMSPKQLQDKHLNWLYS